MTHCEWEAQGNVTWAFSIRQLDDTTYALSQGRDLSLVTLEGIKEFLQQHLGGERDHTVGGGHVG